MTVTSEEALAFFQGLNSIAARAIAEVLPSNAVIFDIGSNAGTFTREMCTTGKPFTVTLFEPITHLLNVSRATLADVTDSTFTFVNAGVGDHHGELTLFLPNDGNIGWITAIREHATSTRRVHVPLCDIAPYLTRERPDFIKIDVEGAESPILRRIADNLGSTNHLMIYVELAWGRHSANWSTTMSSLGTFSEAGYSFAELDDARGDFSIALNLRDLSMMERTVDLLLTPGTATR